MRVKVQIGIGRFGHSDFWFNWFDWFLASGYRFFLGLMLSYNCDLSIPCQRYILLDTTMRITTTGFRITAAPSASLTM